MSNEIATRSAPPPRLPMPVDAGVDAGQWRVLTEAIFPSAKSADAIMLALSYCRARQLDVMRRPVNIVPIWNSALGKYVETVWPSINEIEVTAARTKEWAGMDEPKWGPLITETFRGRKKTREGWKDHEVELTYPEFCAVTVYRLIGGGVRCAFTEPVYWSEAYGRVGGTNLPNDMWTKRPYGQLHKVAKAASLRAAFPEEGDHAAEEMEDQTTTAEALPPPAPADNWQPPADLQNVDQHQAHDPETGEIGPRDIEHEELEPWRDWCARLLIFVRAESELEPIEAWVKANQKHIATLTTEAPKIHNQLTAAIGRHRLAITQRQEAEQHERAQEQATDFEREQREQPE